MSSAHPMLEPVIPAPYTREWATGEVARLEQQAQHAVRHARPPRERRAIRDRIETLRRAHRLP